MEIVRVKLLKMNLEEHSLPREGTTPKHKKYQNDTFRNRSSSKYSPGTLKNKEYESYNIPTDGYKLV